MEMQEMEWQDAHNVGVSQEEIDNAPDANATAAPGTPLFQLQLQAVWSEGNE